MKKNTSVPIIKRVAIDGRTFVFRYPIISDAKECQDFINELSQERTFIRFQGERVSLAEEKRVLADWVSRVKQRKSVHLLAFDEQTGRLAGNTQISLADHTERHIGHFGISLRPEYRGLGLGRLLMESVIEQAKLRLPGLEIILLECHAQNKRALNLYQSLGFTECGRLAGGVYLGEKRDDRLTLALIVG